MQLQPPGLLGLTQLKTGGVVPDALAQTIQPEFDILEFWLRASREIWQTTSSLVAPPASFGFGAFNPGPIIVPETQWWYVHSYSIVGRAAAVGDGWSNFRGAMAFNTAGTQRVRFLGEPTFAGLELAASSPTFNATILAERFWAPPGANLGFYIGNVTGVTGFECLLASLDYTRCPI